MINTSLNIDRQVFQKISDLADEKSITKAELIIDLLKQLMSECSLEPKINRSVKYQKPRNKKDWHIFRIKLKEYDYQYFIDMRNFYKMSVSKLLALAVSLYLEDDYKGMYNYTQKNYILLRNVVEGVIRWQIFWGFPEKVIEFLPKHESIDKNY